jgi:hypothetical protein
MNSEFLSNKANNAGVLLLVANNIMILFSNNIFNNNSV